MRNTNTSILLVGAGYMAIEYAKVLKALHSDFIVIGRGTDSAKKFLKETGIVATTRGLNEFLNKNYVIPSSAIVAVNEDQLGITTLQLLQRGVKTILVEKPGGVDFEEIKKVKKQSLRSKAEVYIAYNRRFYTSVEKATEIINKDGGILSVFFDFTELENRVVPLIRPSKVKENWFLHNSTHVIDLVLFLAGIPEKITSYIHGSLFWHSPAAIFTGAGIMKKGTLFSYHANWKAPGRWSVEIMTKNHKLFLKPLERLQIQELNSFEVKNLTLDDKIDIDFKPGIYKEVKSFLGNKENLCTIEEQVKHLKIYKQILKVS